MATDVDRTLIAEQVRAIDIHEFKAWQDLEQKVHGVAFVAMEVDGSTFDVEKDGAFRGRVNLLLDAPYTGLSGQELKYSLVVPAGIDGSIDGKNVNVTNVRMQF